MDGACIWTENSDGVWETQCGNLFEITADTPEENGMKFCCYCGEQLVEVRYVESDHATD